MAGIIEKYAKTAVTLKQRRTEYEPSSPAAPRRASRSHAGADGRLFTEKKFSPSPGPPFLFKKSGVF